MFVRLVQATAITLALYGLLGLDTLQASTAQSNSITTTESTAEAQTSEVLVALKQALVRGE
jgi:hypothetical protein